MKNLHKIARGCTKPVLRWCVSAATCGAEHLCRCRSGERTGLRILMYHDVSSKREPWNPFAVSMDAFEKQMRVLAKENNVIGMDEGVAALLSGRVLPARAVAITFDDGYRGVVENALPILKALELPATLFLRCDVLEKAAGSYMTWNEAKRWLEYGFSIGAHGMRHRSLGRIRLEEAQAEIESSKAVLETRLGTRVGLFAYPYGTGGDINPDVIGLVRKAGYRAAVTAINGTNTIGACPFLLRRTKVEGSDSIATFRRLLRGGMDAWSIVDRFAWWVQTPRRDNDVRHRAPGEANVGGRT